MKTAMKFWLNIRADVEVLRESEGRWMRMGTRQRQKGYRSTLPDGRDGYRFRMDDEWWKVAASDVPAAPRV